MVSGVPLDVVVTAVTLYQLQELPGGVHDPRRVGVVPERQRVRVCTVRQLGDVSVCGHALIATVTFNQRLSHRMITDHITWRQQHASHTQQIRHTTRISCFHQKQVDALICVSGPHVHALFVHLASLTVLCLVCPTQEISGLSSGRNPAVFFSYPATHGPRRRIRDQIYSLFHAQLCLLFS